MAVTLKDSNDKSLEITNNTTGNAATATYTTTAEYLGSSTVKMWAGASNELRIGAASANLIFGYASPDSSLPVPTVYEFRAEGEKGATVKAGAVYGAVANDYADSIEVNKNCDLEPGYCYCFNGKKYYKSSKYLDDGIIGIHSNTFGFNTGQKGRCKEMDVAVSGFALAYVDKIYKPGTPLTCTKDGYLTEIKMEDKIKYPERIVGTFWKEEKNEIWEPETKNVKVKGRHWVKVK